MKKMKTQILSLFAILALLASCESDDTVANETLLAIPTESSVSVSLTSTETTVSEDGGQVTFEVNLTSPLPYDVDVTLGATSSDGNPTDGDYSIDSATIDSGDTTASFTVTFIDDGVVDVSEVYTFFVENVASSSGNYDSGSYLTVGESNISDITAVDEPTIITTAGDVDIILRWSTFEDLDLYLRDEPGFDGSSPNIDFSWFSQPETMVMPGSLDDGDYYIGVDNYSVSPPYNVACELSLFFPDGQSLIPLTELTDFIWIRTTKVTVGTEVWYYIVTP